MFGMFPFAFWVFSTVELWVISFLEIGCMFPLIAVDINEVAYLCEKGRESIVKRSVELCSLIDCLERFTSGLFFLLFKQEWGCNSATQY